jgi:hypothetical protein
VSSKQQADEHPAVSWLREQNADTLWTTAEIAKGIGLAPDGPLAGLSQVLLAASDSGQIERFSPDNRRPATYCMTEFCRRKHPVYNGPDLPKWVQPGARAKVKATPDLRRCGVRVFGSISHASDDRAFPSDVGTVERREGSGWWDYAIVFSRGRRCVLSQAEDIENFVRVREPKATGEKQEGAS